MSDDDKSLVRRFFNKSLAPKEKKEREVKIVQPKPRKSYFGQKLDTRRVEEYEKTVRAVEGVVRASGDLEEAVGDLENIDIRIDTNKNRFLEELEESKQKLEGLMNNGELREEQRTTEILEERSRQGKAEAEKMESEAQIAEAKVRIAEAEEKIRKSKEPPPPQQQPKTMIDRINEKDKKIRKIRETITDILQKNMKAIEEEGKIKGMTAQEIEDKKDLERARLNKIEMEEIEKLERKYR